MAEKLAQFYEEAKKLGGLKAQMRLAVKTGVTSTKAPQVPDAPETIAKFESAMNEIRKEFS